MVPSNQPCLYPILRTECIRDTNGLQKRGLVPSLSYNGTIITESAIVAQFIADAHPSHLLPTSSPAENAIYRARLAFFVDTFFAKVVPHMFAGFRSASEEERDAAAEQLVGAVAKEIEPLLVDGKGPFFGGSEKLTLAEVCLTWLVLRLRRMSLTVMVAQVQSGSFLLRILALSKPEHGILSTKLPGLLESVPKFKRWAEETVKQESVNFIWDESAVAEKTRARFAPKP